MTCRFCIAQLPEWRSLCHFHMKTMALREAGRCIWCQRAPGEVVFPRRAKSYCLPCLGSRIRQGGGEHHKLSNAMWRATA